MSQALLDSIAEQRKHPLPTPQVGTTVVWFENNDQGNPRAAIVTKIEDPGKLSLVVFSPMQIQQHKQGVWHCSHEIHQARGNPQTFRSGSWDYPTRKPPKEDFKPYLDYLERREESVGEEMMRQEQAAQARKAKQAAGV